ncbi:hypothetical protein [Paraherbaspirillum soli]|uniref:Uncharacterized protein n=1 Tax=Paraherbaspirillum soli TaxID=631222 RepID=A0ABW0MCW9_9BURK
MYQVNVKLIVSGKDFQPNSDLMTSTHLHRAWKEGDLVIPQATKKFEDAGVVYRLLHEYSDMDWAEVMLENLKEIAALITGVSVTMTLPTPQLSVFIETDGRDYPPIFLSREILDVLDSIYSEVDIDVVHSL